MKKRIEILSEFTGQFKILEHTCDCRRKYGPVLCADNSGGEYAECAICQECANKAFQCWDGELNREAKGGE